MDPLSVIASVIAITEAFGVGIKALKSLADTSSEFNDMLAELSSLQAWLSQLRATIDGMTTAEVEVPLDVLRRLELAKVELSQVVNSMSDVRRKLIGGENDKKLNKKGEPKVSVITWQRMRGRIQKLRDKAKRCREELSACLDLVGLSQQLQQHQTSRDILTISHTQYLLMQTTMVRFESRFDHLESMLLGNMQSPEPPGVEPLPDGHHSEPLVGSMASSQVGTTMLGRESSSATQIQVPLRQKCSRYCKCQCHRSSAIQTPSWSHALIGSMMLQFNGTVRLDTNPCDLTGCNSGKGRELRVAYTFPSWLIHRAVQFMANWGSLADMGATLHLHVPRVCEPVGIWEALQYQDVQWFRNNIRQRVLLPTDISSAGVGYLQFFAKREHFRMASTLVDLGFKPSFQEPQSGISASMLARRSLLDYRARLKEGNGPPDELELNRMVKVAGETEEEPEISTIIRDAILGVGNLSLEDSLAVEGDSINEIDDTGCAPLHWAIRLGKLEQVQLLVQHGADIELPDRYQRQTPLRCAALASRRRIVAFLLSKGARVSPQTPNLSCCGMLHECSDPEVVRMLLQANADPNEAGCEQKQSPLHHLSVGSIRFPIGSKGRASLCNIAAQYVHAGADLEARTVSGLTPLLLAVAGGRKDLCQQLVGLGARVDATDNQGANILHYAAVAGDMSVIEFVRSLGVVGLDPDSRTSWGTTADDFLKLRVGYPGIRYRRTPLRTRHVFDFYALVSEIRRRNWELGLFLERKEQLERSGHLDRTRRWLGWQCVDLSRRSRAVGPNYEYWLTTDLRILV